MQLFFLKHFCFVPSLKSLSNVKGPLICLSLDRNIPISLDPNGVFQRSSHSSGFVCECSCVCMDYKSTFALKMRPLRSALPQKRTSTTCQENERVYKNKPVSGSSQGISPCLLIRDLKDLWQCLLLNALPK